MALSAGAGMAGLATLLAVAVALQLSPPAANKAGQATARSSGQRITSVSQVAALTTATMHRITVQGLERRYEVIQPQRPVAKKLPVLVFLHGINTGIATEENRDGLLPYVTAGQVILVYPIGFEESWNDGACCSAANRHDVDDVAFLTNVVHAAVKMQDADPGMLYVAGYSDGGKMAFHLICQEPRLVTGAVVVAAVEATACPAGRPVPLLEAAGTNDPLNPYQHVVQQIRGWVKRDRCAPSTSADAYNTLTLQHWSTCARGSQVELATYAGAGHSPFGGNGTPPLTRVMMSFVERSPFTG
jgi:polyhydroxybutyrate depolymerase